MAVIRLISHAATSVTALSFNFGSLLAPGQILVLSIACLYILSSIFIFITESECMQIEFEFVIQNRTLKIRSLFYITTYNRTLAPDDSNGD